MSGVSLSSPAGRGCYLDRMLEVTRIGSTFHGRVAIGGSSNKELPGRPLDPSYIQNCFVAG